MLPSDPLKSTKAQLSSFTNVHDPSRTQSSPMYSGFNTSAATDAQQAWHSLEDEGKYRFPSFSSNDAVTLGLSIRKRFRASSRHGKGKGLVISIETIGGHKLFSCTVGDLGHPSGLGDTSLDSWECLDGMISVTKRTGHSSYYVEKGMSAAGMSLKQGQGESRPVGGDLINLHQNAPCCPIAIVAAYSGSSLDDHTLVVTTVRDYLTKMFRNSSGTIAATSVVGGPSLPTPHIPIIPQPPTAPADWPPETFVGTTTHPGGGPQSTAPPASQYDHDHDHDDL